MGIFRESYSNTFSSIRWIFTELRGYVLIALLLTLVNSIVQPFWVLYAKQEVLLIEYEWGQVLLVAGVAKTVLSLFIGTMMDRLGTRKCMMIGLFVAAPTMILFTMAGGFYHVVAVYFVLVIANAFLWIASNVLLADSIPRSTRGRVMASMGQGIGVGISGGGYARGFLLFIPATIGSMLGGYIYDYNAAYPWLIQSVVLLVCVGFTYMLVKEPEKAQA